MRVHIGHAVVVGDCCTAKSFQVFQGWDVKVAVANDVQHVVKVLGDGRCDGPVARRADLDRINVVQVGGN